MIDGLPIFQLIIDELCEEDGVSVMSIVDDPAVEKDFLKFRKDRKKSLKYSLNEEKRIVTRVALRCDYPIYRKDEDGKEYYITMDAATIEKICQKFMREMRLQEVNVQHSRDVQDVYLVESFILLERHRLGYPEFGDVSDGSWIVSYKVDNPQVWKQIRQGTLRGFSVEVTGSMQEQKMKRKMKWKANGRLMEIYNFLNLIETYEFIAKSESAAGPDAGHSF